LSDFDGVPAGFARRLLPGLLQLLVDIMEAAIPDGAESIHAARERDGPLIMDALKRTIRTSMDISPDGIEIADVAGPLGELHWQIAALRRASLDCPVVRPGESWIPLALGSRDPWTTPSPSAAFVRRPNGVIEPLGFSVAPLDRVAHLMAPHLASFLALRTLFGGSPVTGNVEVSNKAGGWNILHSPPHLMNHNAFGGPSSPVTNYLAPGNYHFAISSATQTIWDSATWSIPPTVHATPPHKVHVPLP